MSLRDYETSPAVLAPIRSGCCDHYQPVGGVPHGACGQIGDDDVCRGEVSGAVRRGHGKDMCASGAAGLNAGGSVLDNQAATDVVAKRGSCFEIPLRGGLSGR